MQRIPQDLPIRDEEDHVGARFLEPEVATDTPFLCEIDAVSNFDFASVLR